MGIVPRDPNRASCSPDRILSCNGEETTKTRAQRVQANHEIPIPRQIALSATRTPLCRNEFAGSIEDFLVGGAVESEVVYGELVKVRRLAPLHVDGRLLPCVARQFLTPLRPRHKFLGDLFSEISRAGMKMSQAAAMAMVLSQLFDRGVRRQM